MIAAEEFSAAAAEILLSGDPAIFAGSFCRNNKRRLKINFLSLI